MPKEQKSFQNNDAIITDIGVDAEWGIHRVFDGETCKPPAVNCFDDIIITTKSQVEFSSYMKKGSQGVKNYFLSDKYQELFPNLIFNEKYLSKLQSGNYSCLVIIKQNQSFYLFGREGGLSDKNYEFVFVLKFE